MVHNARRTHASRVRIDLVRFGCVKMDGFFPSVEDERIVDRGFSVSPNGEKSERHCPKIPQFHSLVPSDLRDRVTYQMV